ncbi:MULTISPECIES: bifunctional 2-polyprenyl-6-hydroxyphenol methylase/3-demethylubiquinol 3-O-methyltransferase UbiG [unclassified Anabaena]|uniref:class I SAM-dependent methyltransferase n=1 Tax=unclassified Anabaena TaxID=2619674 RepID=UPI000834690C|nr:MULTISPECIES: class I SAM-dependent methyltransferase [unclassified Anabaena]
MQANTNQYEYSYKDSNTEHHHTYLLSPLLDLMGQEPVKQNQKLRVLDLGCGSGSLSHKIAQHGYEVVGVDDSASGIFLASQNFPDCRFIQASIYNLPENDLNQSFDIVIAVEVIEHLFYPRELLRAAKRYLKPEGRLIITTPYNGYWKNLALALLGKMDSHYTALWDGGHIKFFSVATLTNLLQEEGFDNTIFKFSGRLPYLWKSMLCASTLAKI